MIGSEGYGKFQDQKWIGQYMQLVATVVRVYTLHYNQQGRRIK